MSTPYEKIVAALATYSDEQCRTYLANEISESLLDYKPNELRALVYSIWVTDGASPPISKLSRAELDRDVLDSLLELYGDRQEDEPAEAACNRFGEEALTDLLDDLDTGMSAGAETW